METNLYSRSFGRHPRLAWIAAGAFLGAMMVIGTLERVGRLPAVRAESNHSAPIPAADFARMVQEFSEPGGFFHSDNFTSNENAYLHISDKLKELGISGGAYLGVGPEQNFSYIAKIRPQIAFIIDIRRQAIIQHLMYKAIFHQAANRAQFLSLLFSKPLPASAAQASTEELLQRISEGPTSKATLTSNLAAIRKTITETFHFPLSAEDLKSLEYVYSSFWQANLQIGFRFDGGYGGWSWGMPNFRDLILATDLRGNRGNFLAHDEDYEFVRNLQEQNRVIPVVGDFGGRKAIATVADYLKKNGYTVSAFYTSNVEEFLYQNDVFGAFAANVSKLPISDRSVFIRSVRRPWVPEGASTPGDRMTPLLENISDFLQDYKQGRIPDYGSLVNNHFIAGSVEHGDASPAFP